MKYADLDYSNLSLSPDLTVEDIHKIRKYEYEATKDLSPEEFHQFYNDKLQAERKQLKELKLNNKHYN